MPRRLKLASDYGCSPVWEVTGGAYENIDPSDLPISERLADALTLWAADFDETLNTADPLMSGFATDLEARRFEAEGRRLWKSLCVEMPEAEIEYAPEEDSSDQKRLTR